MLSCPWRLPELEPSQASEFRLQPDLDAPGIEA